MPPRPSATRTTPPERRALQDLLAWPISITLLLAAAVVFVLPRFVPSPFLTVAIGATFAITTISLIGLLAWLIERWLGRQATGLAREAEREVQRHGVPGLLAAGATSPLTPLASAYADAGARAALRTAAREQADFLARLGSDLADTTERAITIAEPAAGRALDELRHCTAALRHVTAPIPAASGSIDAIGELQSLVASLPGDGRARVVLDIGVDRAPVSIDRDRFRRDVLALVDCARFASPPSTTVTVHASRIFRANLEDTPVRRTGDSRLTIVPRTTSDGLREWLQRSLPSAEVLSVVISDAGPALAADELRRVLDPFAVPRPGDPLGVALATARRTVMLAGGLLWVDGSREGGAAVHLLLPFAT